MYVVGDGLGMLLDGFHCNMGSKIVSMLFSMHVFIKCVGFFCNSFNTQCVTSSLCHLVERVVLYHISFLRVICVCILGFE